MCCYAPFYWDLLWAVSDGGQWPTRGAVAPKLVIVVHLRARRVYCRQANEAQSVQATWRGCLNEGQDPNGWYRRPGRHPWVSPCGADGTSSRRALAEGDAAVTVRGVGQTPTLRGAALASALSPHLPCPKDEGEDRVGGRPRPLPKGTAARFLAKGNRCPYHPTVAQRSRPARPPTGRHRCRRHIATAPPHRPHRSHRRPAHTRGGPWEKNAIKHNQRWLARG